MRQSPIRPRPPAGARRGLTLVEVVIVVLILGILAAASAPRFADALAYHQLTSVARRITSDIEFARQRAKSQSSGCTVSFDVAGNRYSLFPGVADPDHPSRTYSVDLAAESSRTSLFSADFGGTASVTFNGYGLPSAGGQVVVRGRAAQAVILVDAQTGQAVIQK